MVPLHRNIALLAGSLLLLASPSARAEEPVETALKNLVASIDASPDWAASYRDLQYDPASGIATLSGLSVATESRDVTVDFDRITVNAYQAAADGGFAAHEITAEGGTVNTAFVKVSIGDVDLSELAVPGLSGIVYDKAKPFTSMVRAYREILKARLAHGEINSIELIEKINDMTSRISYQRFTIENLQDGRLASVKAGPLALETPAPEGLVSMSVAGVESHDIDIGAAMRVYDPDAYVGGVGDMVWRTVLGSASYHDATIEMQGAKLSVGDVTIANFKARQPQHSFADFFDQIMISPAMPESQMQELAKRNALELFSAFGFGRFSVSNVEVAATGIDRFRLADFHVNDVSSDGLGEFGIGGLEGAVEGQGSVKVGKFAFGGIKFPSVDLLKTVLSEDVRTGAVPFDPSQLIPTLGFVEADGIEVISPDVPRTALDRFRLDLGNYVGHIPTSVAAEMVGLLVPAALMDRQGREGLARLGLDALQANFGVKLGWSEPDQTLNVDDFHVGIGDLGAITASGVLGGLTRDAIEAANRMEETIPDLSLVNAKITFTDDKIVDKGLAMLAEKMHFPPDKIRQQFADALPFLLSVTVLTDPTMMKIFRQTGLLAKVTPAIKAFMAAPGSSITVTLAPPKPVPLAGIAPVVQTAPETIVGTLGLSVTAEAAPAPGVPGPEPQEPTKPAP